MSPRVPRAYRLSGVERILLTLYHTVPVSVRAHVGRTLFDAWVGRYGDARR